MSSETDNNIKIEETEEIPFWANDPNILFHKDHIFELFPTSKMSYEQKLNAITRLILIVTIVSFLLTMNYRLLIVSAFTLFSIFLLYFYKVGEQTEIEIEGYDNPAEEALKQSGKQFGPEVFDTPTSSNPFSNVLITDYDYNPNKRPAPPSYNEDINEKIMSEAKLLVQEANPDQLDISDKLFRDLGEQYVFEQSLRPFTSNPSTTIPNDQQAFAEFCYGSMISCKEGNMFACARNLARHTN